MNRSNSYVAALWLASLLAVAVTGWGKQMEASAWIQSAGTVWLGFMLRHLMGPLNDAVASVTASSQAAPVADPAVTQEPVIAAAPESTTS